MTELNKIQKKKYLKELKIIFSPDKQTLMMTKALHDF